jgi:adenylate cyclase
MGRYLFKHKSDVLTVFEVMGQREQATAAAQILCARFAAALAVFNENRWAEAAALFEDILQEYPLDGPTRFYLQRCRRNNTDGIEETDGAVIRLSSK